MPSQTQVCLPFVLVSLILGKCFWVTAITVKESLETALLNRLIPILALVHAEAMLLSDFIHFCVQLKHFKDAIMGSYLQ